MALLLISPPDAEEIPRVCVWSNCPDIDERVGEFEVVHVIHVIHADTHAGLDFLPLRKNQQ